jgi:hypothetical protein
MPEAEAVLSVTGTINNWKTSGIGGWSCAALCVSTAARFPPLYVSTVSYPENVFDREATCLEAPPTAMRLVSIPSVGAPCSHTHCSASTASSTASGYGFSGASL